MDTITEAKAICQCGFPATRPNFIGNDTVGYIESDKPIQCYECWKIERTDLSTCHHCHRLYPYQMLDNARDENICPNCAEHVKPCSVCGAPYYRHLYAHEGQSYCYSCFHQRLYQCCQCGHMGPRDEATIAGGDDYCPNCNDEFIVSCDCCGENIHMANTNTVYNGYDICDHCLSSEYFCCHQCEEFYPHTDIVRTSDDYALCPHCAGNTNECEECGRIFYCDLNGDGLCADCQREYERPGTYIHNYGYQPRPKFQGVSHGATTPYFGIELEVERKGYSSNIGFLDDPFLYLKHDESLDNGFEIVSHPGTIEFHESFQWEDILDSLQEGHLSHDTDTCGLHVHISRVAFQTEESINTLLFIFEKHWKNILAISRRTEARANKWAARYFSTNEITIPPNILRCKFENIKDYYQGRYRAINFCNKDTIEIRIFRGTLIYNSFMATLYFCSHLVHICNTFKIEDLENTDFKTLIELSGNETLIEYVRGRL